MHPPHGYTLLDVITATAVIFVIGAAIVLLIGPEQTLRESYDDAREEDVRNIAEAFFEFSYREPEAAAAMLTSAGTGRFMIGQGASCAGSLGIQCSDAAISDACVDLSEHLTPAYLEEIPEDPRGSLASQTQAGYFLEWDGLKLTIGSCNPEARSNIEISTRL